MTRKPRVDTVIIGALRDNLAAPNWTRLDEVRAFPLPHPHWHQQRYAGNRNPPAKHVRQDCCARNPHPGLCRSP
jgi:hypothetical protein